MMQPTFRKMMGERALVDDTNAEGFGSLPEELTMSDTNQADSTASSRRRTGVPSPDEPCD